MSVIGCTCCPRNRSGADPGSSSLKAHVPLICTTPAHPGKARGVGPEGRADSGNMAPMPGVVQILWDRGKGVAEDKIIQGAEKKPEKQVLRGAL